MTSKNHTQVSFSDYFVSEFQDHSLLGALFLENEYIALLSAPSLAPLPLSLNSDILPGILLGTHPEQFNISLQTPGLSPSSLGQSPRDPRRSPETPEQEISFASAHPGSSIGSSGLTIPKNSRINTEYEKASYLSSSDGTSQGYSQPEPSYFAGQHPEGAHSPLTSPPSAGLTHDSAGPSGFKQVTTRPPPSRNRRKHDKQLNCSSCLKVFSRRCDLNKHARTHLKGFKCDIAGCTHTQGFALYKDLRRHKETIHFKSTFTCYFPSCGQQFSRADNCQRHFEEQHSQETSLEQRLQRGSEQGL